MLSEVTKKGNVKVKITKINTRAVKTSLNEPLRIAFGLVTHSVSVIVEVETDEGLVGIGEGSPSIIVTGETIEGTLECLRVFERDLIGVDPTDLEKVYWIVDRAAFHAPCGKTAIDMACHDLLGKKCGMPVYKLLGGYDNCIKTDITLGIDIPEVMAEKAKKYVNQGFDIIKVKVGTVLEDDIARVKAIREAVGPDVLIRVDANQAWTPKGAVRAIGRISEYGIELVEQPVKFHDIKGLSYVTKYCGVPVMADESCFTPNEVLRVIEERAADLVNIKLMKCGGIRQALCINSICEAAGVECMLGCMIEETNIAITAAASLGAAVKNITRADLDAVFGMTHTIYKGGVDYSEKILKLPDTPGFGFIA